MTASNPQSYNRSSLPRLAARVGLADELLREAQVVSLVLPFRVSRHVVDELIDWSDPVRDPMYRLTFPRRGMLDPDHYAALEAALERRASAAEIRVLVNRIRDTLNPDPSDQHRRNVPAVDGEPLAGTQHKYSDTVLYFPAEGQTCHAFCSYCFRWPQFSPGQPRFATRDPEAVARYVRANPAITDVLFTGGDPFVMRASVLRRHIEPFLAPGLEHLTIRIGTKALSYHPARFTEDRDADELARLLEEVAERRSLAVMAHLSHPRELESRATQAAVRRVIGCGASVRCQSPIVRGVNDDPATWAALWSAEVRAGAFPYYMFVERDTGAHRWFRVPLAEALRVYDEAIARSPGLARTARGPVMSAAPGKVLVEGIVRKGDRSAFALKLIRARDPGAANRRELAEFDAECAWLDELSLLGSPGQAPFAEATPALA
jgi:L-lysine 2,3-aminomutase